jgi:hypothetical protein
MSPRRICDQRNAEDNSIYIVRKIIFKKFIFVSFTSVKEAVKQAKNKSNPRLLYEQAGIF